MLRLARGARRPVMAAMLAGTMMATSACVRWQTVPPADVSAQPILPRWVRVTTRDSTHLLIEHASFHGDTLIGRPSDDANAPLARIPTADIAHLEARSPSLLGSLGVTALVLGAVLGFFVAVASAAQT